ncbi:MAG: DUF3393 domain-containing protein [Nitrosomonadales bacterium]|nr:DUF3393 domain-containing protein [Nitrosomonadales bacterium]
MNRNSRLLAASLLAAALLAGCSRQEMMRIALEKDPGKALQALAKSRVNAYKYDPERVFEDIKRAQAEYNRLIGNLRKESGKKWGKKEAGELPTKTRYVKYTEDYRNRVIVDFDRGTMLIEHLEDEKVQEKMKGAIVAALMTPGDPRAVDLFSDKPVGLDGTPYLQGLIPDQNGNLIATREDAGQFADYLVGSKLQARKITVNGASRNVRYVQIAMVNNHVEKKAMQFSPLVRKHSETTEVSRSLIFAVMKVESGFNPFAVSGAPAFGLMQLVPTSGGRDAYRKARGIDEPPTREYLFEPENNIELGSTYLGVLMNDSPLRDIGNPVSREYCAIAAYNTGAGNVFRAFSPARGSARQTEALGKINSLSPEEVYEKLKTDLPYAETRDYIVKVVAAKKRYAAM